MCKKVSESTPPDPDINAYEPLRTQFSIQADALGTMNVVSSNEPAYIAIITLHGVTEGTRLWFRAENGQFKPVRALAMDW